MKKYILISILLSIFISVNAQREAYNWLFGYGATLTWSDLRSFSALDIYDTNGELITGVIPTVTLNNLPSPIKVNGLVVTSPMNTSEGCFSLSDYAGQLLFFSDGINVWNKNGAKMPNGNATLNGHSSSAQSGIIFPYPGHPNQYVTVTLGYNNTNNVGYSIIDMSEDGGLGDVILENGLLSNKLNGGLGETGETVTAVAHSNKKDYWIVALGRGSKSYLNIWHVNKNGVHANAPSSTYEIEGISTVTDLSSPNGYIKFSPDGKHFACWVKWGITGNVPGFLVGKFDPKTGTISNMKYQIMRDRTNTVSITRGYGIEFSEDGKYLYACNTTGNRGTINVPTELHIYEFEKLLNAPNDLPNTNSIEPEKRFTNPANQPTYRFNGLQMGPDKRIYIAALNFDSNADKGSMFVIDNPNDISNVKIYYLPNFSNALVSFGLPSYSSAWFTANIKGETDFCINTAQEYTLNMDTDGLGLVDLLWDFGDGGSIVSNIGDLKQIHVYNKRGKYTITITPRKAGNIEVPELTTTLDIKVNNCMLPVNHNISNMEY